MSNTFSMGLQSGNQENSLCKPEEKSVTFCSISPHVFWHTCAPGPLFHPSQKPPKVVKQRSHHYFLVFPQLEVVLWLFASCNFISLFILSRKMFPLIIFCNQARSHLEVPNTKILMNLGIIILSNIGGLLVNLFSKLVVNFGHGLSSLCYLKVQNNKLKQSKLSLSVVSNKKKSTKLCGPRHFQAEKRES